MKTTCKYCGIVSKPHKCPHSKRKTDYSRADKKIYGTQIWIDLRETVLEDYNHICLWSLYVDGETKAADEVHHIIEILECEELAYDYDNLIPLEFFNHKKVHRLYKKNKEKFQQLLTNMINDYRSGDRTLGKYKKYVEGIPPTI